MPGHTDGTYALLALEAVGVIVLISSSLICWLLLYVLALSHVLCMLAIARNQAILPPWCRCGCRHHREADIIYVLLLLTFGSTLLEQLNQKPSLRFIKVNCCEINVSIGDQ